jgi:hypothetical protein
MIFISSSTRAFAAGMAKNPLSSADDGRPCLFSGNYFGAFPNVARPTERLKPESRQDQGGNQHSNSHGRDREKYSGHESHHIA